MEIVVFTEICIMPVALGRFTDPLMQSLVELVELQRKISQWNY